MHLDLLVSAVTDTGYACIETGRERWLYCTDE